jgi:ABC-2 type transport system ATP-binding protein
MDLSPTAAQTASTVSVMSVCEILNFTVRYGHFTAVSNLTVNIPTGCVGLLGPNGAGKTTLLKTMLGFITPSEGTATILGKDVVRQSKEIRQIVGLMPEQDCHIPGMTAVMFVAYAGELAGMPKDQALRRAHEVLEYCGLGEARYRNVETYSTGMKQRIKLAQALVHGPKLLLLDEPTNGLDPAGREQMLDLIASVSHGKGLNVIVSSHLLPDIERICDDVVVIANGTLRKTGKVKDLKKIEGRPVDVELREENPGFISAATGKGLSLVSQDGYRCRFQGNGTPADVCKVVIQAAKESGAQIRGFGVAERSLEEAFLEVLNV